MFVRFQDSSPISDSPPESTAEKASEEFVKVVPKSSPPVKQEDTKPVEEPVEKAPEKVEEPSEEFKSTPDKVESVQKKPEKESEKAEPAADKADEDASSDDDGVDLDRYLTEAKTSMKESQVAQGELGSCLSSRSRQSRRFLLKWSLMMTRLLLQQPLPQTHPLPQARLLA